MQNRQQDTIKQLQVKINAIKHYHDYDNQPFWEQHARTIDANPEPVILCSSKTYTEEQAALYLRAIQAVEPKENHAGFYYAKSRVEVGQFRIVAVLSKIDTELSKKCIEAKKNLIVAYLNQVALPKEVFQKHPEYNNEDNFWQQRWEINKELIGYYTPSEYSNDKRVLEIETFLQKKMASLFKDVIEREIHKFVTAYYLKNNEFLYTRVLEKAEKYHVMHPGLLAMTTLSAGENTESLPPAILFKIGLFAQDSVRSLALVNKAAAEVDKQFNLTWK